MMMAKRKARKAEAELKAHHAQLTKDWEAQNAPTLAQQVAQGREVKANEEKLARVVGSWPPPEE